MKRQIINVSTATRKMDIFQIKTDMIAIGVFEGSINSSAVLKQLDEKLGGAVKKVYKFEDFKGKALSSVLLYGNEKIKANKVLLVGLGDKKKFKIDVLRRASGLACKRAVADKCKNVSLALVGDVKDIDLVEAGIAMGEGAYFGAYKYDEFVSESSRPRRLDVWVVDNVQNRLTKLSKGLKIGSVIGDAQCISRTLSNRPGNVMYPGALVSEARKLAAKTVGLTCKVFDEKQLKQKKMGGILAVGCGSARPPRMIVIKYSPRNAKAVKASPVALVGKAITFDSGGISIKPSAGMDCMKFDMTGGASVLAAMAAIARLKLPIEVYGIVCAAENMLSSNSWRPGDIVTTYSGKTVEVLNTDAEGRMVLGDGIHYAKTLKCKTVIDICTLTGACFIALGHYNAGLMGNDEKLISQLKEASEKSGEPLWHLPCGEEYAEEMKSKIADLQNIGPDRWGGACRAAAFIGEFAKGTSWAHLDIAPMMEPGGTLKKITGPGSIGFGVRIFTRYIMGLCGRK